MSAFAARLFVWLQYLLPRYWLTAIVYRVSRIRNVRIKDTLITRFVSLYDIATDELARDVPADFRSLNDFFTRELAENARPVDTAAASIVSPVDGTVSAAGPIDGPMIFQAKGKAYSLHDLLATNIAEADAYVDGQFATIYLAPYNYHRVHTPLAGELTGARYVPGDLFSVNAATADKIEGLFSRNERLICDFSTATGPMAVILVGALNVGSITTPWTGEVRPRKRGVGEELRLDTAVDRRVDKGGLIGWFNMGSTVIVLWPPGVAELDTAIRAGLRVTMGQAMGRTIVKATRPSSGLTDPPR